MNEAEANPALAASGNAAVAEPKKTPTPARGGRLLLGAAALMVAVVDLVTREPKKQRGWFG